MVDYKDSIIETTKRVVSEKEITKDFNGSFNSSFSGSTTQETTKETTQEKNIVSGRILLCEAVNS